MKTLIMTVGIIIGIDMFSLLILLSGVGIHCWLDYQKEQDAKKTSIPRTNPMICSFFYLFY